MKHPFRLKNAVLLMALAAVYPLTALSAAGVAQYAVGDVSVRRGPANLPVAKGQLIESGDNIVTGASGQTQIRFSDGGLVSLAPNSQFNINRYADENDAGKDSFAVSFLRGGMRAITGLIGKRKPENYKVTTNTATIGIRGSAFSAKINPDGTMDVAGEQDTVEVCTNAGCVSLIVGEIVRVESQDRLPSRTAQRSNVPPLAAREDLFTPENPADITPPALPANAEVTEQPGIAAMFIATGDAFSISDSTPRGGDPYSYGGGASFIGSFLTLHDDGEMGYGGSSVLSTTITTPNSGALGAVADADFIGWGYWANGTASGPIGNGPVTDVHYLAGRPTPNDQMPVTGTATYNLALDNGLGGTRPTATSNGTTITGTLLGASLSANFDGGYVEATVNTRFTPGGSGVVDVTITDVANISGSRFSSFGCGNGTVNGFFTGSLAARAGIVYSKSETPVGLVRGAAGFSRGTSSGLSTIPPNQNN